MPGLCLLALAAIGIWRSRRYRAAQALLVISIASVIISLGPQLTIGGLTIWMPVDFIYDHVPILQSIRAWVRIAFYVQIGIALLAGLSFVGFGSLGRSRQVLLCLLAFGVICESISAPLWLSPSGPQPSDRWLAAQPGHGAVVSVPNIYSGANQYAALFHQHPLLIGYGTFTPPGSFEDSSMIMRFPAQVSITTMQRLGAEFVLVRNDLMDREQPGWREDTQQRLGAAPAYQDASVTIYRLHKIIP
jgi:hypothetical protein